MRSVERRLYVQRPGFCGTSGRESDSSSVRRIVLSAYSARQHIMRSFPGQEMAHRLLQGRQNGHAALEMGGWVAWLRRRMRTGRSCLQRTGRQAQQKRRSEYVPWYACGLASRQRGDGDYELGCCLGVKWCWTLSCGSGSRNFEAL